MPAPKRRRLHFSLRTLLLTVLLCGSAATLWFHWEPWALEHTLIGHSKLVTEAAFSADGNRILTESHDTTVRVWDASNGRQITILQGHTMSINSAVFSPDERRIVTGSHDDTARVWDAASGRQLAILEGHEYPVMYAEFTTDGQRILTSSWDKTVRIWDSSSGRLIIKLKEYADWASFSNNRQHIVTWGFGVVHVWDAATGQLIATLNGHSNYVMKATFSPDDRRVLTSSYDNTARVWDVDKQQQLVCVENNFYLNAVFSPDGKYFANAFENTANIRDASSGRPMAKFEGHTKTVRAVAFSVDGERILTTSDDLTVRVWDAIRGQLIAMLIGHKKVPYSAVFLPDGQRVVTHSMDNTTRVWDAATGRQIVSIPDTGNFKKKFSPDGKRILTVNKDGQVCVWMRRHPDDVLGVLVLPALWLTLLLSAAVLWSLRRGA